MVKKWGGNVVQYLEGISTDRLTYLQPSFNTIMWSRHNLKQTVSSKFPFTDSEKENSNNTMSGQMKSLTSIPSTQPNEVKNINKPFRAFGRVLTHQNIIQSTNDNCSIKPVKDPKLSVTETVSCSALIDEQDETLSETLETVNEKSLVSELAKISVENMNLLQSTLIANMNEFDKQYLSNPLQVSHYATEIFSNLYAYQDIFLCKHRVDLNSMHPQVNESMRCLLIDWLIEVSVKYELKEESVFLCTQLIDIYSRLCFQSGDSILRDNFQKVGVCCLNIATKIEEIYPPSIEEFVMICDDAYKQTEIAMQEVDICLKVSFQFSFPTPFTFYTRYSQILKHSLVLHYQGLFLLYLCLMHYEMSAIYVKPSVLAACCCFLVQRASHSQWDDMTQTISSNTVLHKYKDISQHLPIIHKLIKYFKHSDSPFLAIRKKFTSPLYCNAAEVFLTTYQSNDI